MAAEGAIAVDDGGVPVEDRLQQARDVLRVVLQVGIEDDHVLTLGVVDGGLDGRALAGVALVGDHPQPRVVHPARISEVPSRLPSSTTTSSISHG